MRYLVMLIPYPNLLILILFDSVRAGALASGAREQKPQVSMEGLL
jgi:hypothetical protein